jgi:hypothetical protein
LFQKCCKFIHFHCNICIWFIYFDRRHEENIWINHLSIDFICRHNQSMDCIINVTESFINAYITLNEMIFEFHFNYEVNFSLHFRFSNDVVHISSNGLSTTHFDQILSDIFSCSQFNPRLLRFFKR